MMILYYQVGFLVVFHTVPIFQVEKNNHTHDLFLQCKKWNWWRVIVNIFCHIDDTFNKSSIFQSACYTPNWKGCCVYITFGTSSVEDREKKSPHEIVWSNVSNQFGMLRTFKELNHRLTKRCMKCLYKWEPAIRFC